MAEFDAGGLAAVNAFFGNSGDDPSLFSQEEEKKSVKKIARGRLGVGAAAPSSNNPPDKDAGLSGKTIFNVGKRKRNRQQQEEEDYDIDNGQQKQESDSEEEEGRTSIKPTDKLQSARRGEDHDMGTAPNKKKKKKGKKERQAAKQLVKATAEGGTGDLALGKGNNEKPEDGAKAFPPAEPNSTAAINGGRFRRPKARSKQKNIRKDKRAVKPDHLIPGSENYMGRPITPETRRALNLPPKQAFHKRTYKISKQHQQNNADADLGGLAVDDFLREDGNDDNGVPMDKVGVPIQTKKGPSVGGHGAKRKAKKSKKSKYKNL